MFPKFGSTKKKKKRQIPKNSTYTNAMFGREEKWKEEKKVKRFWKRLEKRVVRQEGKEEGKENSTKGCNHI